MLYSIGNNIRNIKHDLISSRHKKANFYFEQWNNDLLINDCSHWWPPMPSRGGLGDSEILACLCSCISLSGSVYPETFVNWQVTVLHGKPDFMWKSLWVLVAWKHEVSLCLSTWEIWHQGILQRKSIALNQSDFLSTWYLVDTYICWNCFTVHETSFTAWQTTSL